MRYLKVLFFSLAFICFMTGGAWAQSSILDICAAGSGVEDLDVDTDPTGAYVVGSEWLAGQAGVVSVDLGNAIPTPGNPPIDRSDIIYIPGINIGIGNTIVITVTNGALAPSVNYGLWNDTAGAPGANLVDFTADSNGNYTRLVFKFLQTRLPTEPSAYADDVLYLTEDLTTGAMPTAAERPTLRFTSAQLLAGNMTLQVTQAFDSTAQPLIAPLTNAEVVAKAIPQLSAKVQYLPGPTDGPATSTIDVEATPSRAKFVVEAGGDTPNTTTSQAQIRVVEATVNNGIDVAAASYTITFHGDQTAITNVALESSNLTRTTGVSWSLTSNFATWDLRTSGLNDLIVTVNGTTTINVATYTVTLVIDPAEVGVADKTVLNQANAFIWTVNAMQARIPYLLIDTRPDSLYSSFITITNRGNLAASVSIDAIISNADTTTNVTETQNDVITVPANSVYIIRQSDLDGWFVNIDNTQLYRVSIVLTVVAPQNTIDVSAYHISPNTNSRTATPVLYNTNNAADGRVWQ